MHGVIQKLSEKRKIFHSEADFQFAIAWEIKLLYNNAEVMLECPLNVSSKAIDIVVNLDDHVYPIELKYKQKNLIRLTDGLD